MKLGEILYKEAQEKAEKEKNEAEKPQDKKTTKGKTKSKGKEKDAKVVDADFEDVTDSKPKKKDDDKSTGTSA